MTCANQKFSVAQQAGELDVEFGNSGLSVHTKSGYNIGVKSFQFMPNGNIIAFGSAYTSAVDEYFFISLNNQGQLMQSFGENGMIVESVTNGSDYPAELFVDLSGNYFAFGSGSGVNGSVGSITAYNLNGERNDALFTAGQMLVEYNSLSTSIRAAVSNNTSKILAGRLGANAFISSFDENWNSQQAFGVDGYIELDFGGTTDVINSISIADDQAIYFGGSVSGSGVSPACTIGKVSANGVIDVLFGNNGMVSFNPGTSTAFVTSIEKTSNGIILVAGIFTVGTQNRGFIRSYLPNGNVNSTFGTDGQVIIDPSSGSEGIWKLLIQPDGKILLGGFATLNGNTDLLLVRLNVDGTFDNSFGTNGVATVDYLGYDDQIIDMDFLDDGKLLVAGSTNSGTLSRALFARFHTGLNIGFAEVGVPSLKVYPNPITDVLRVEAAQPIDGLTISDAFGRSVHVCHSGPCPTGIDLSHLATGIYHISMHTNGQYLSKKVVKQ